jgi:hypothetical protein
MNLTWKLHHRPQCRVLKWRRLSRAGFVVYFRWTSLIFYWVEKCNVQQQLGDYKEPVYSFPSVGNNSSDIRTGHLKFDTVTNYELENHFLKYCLKINNSKHDNIWNNLNYATSDNFNVHGSGTKPPPQKEKNNSCNMFTNPARQLMA